MSIKRGAIVFVLFSSLLNPTVFRLSPQEKVAPPPIIEHPVLTPERLDLLRDYMRLHYGLDTVSLPEPAMIVVHYTAISSLAGSLKAFENDTLPPSRTDITGHGDVNVGVHFVIAKDGAVYRLQPENIVGRHAIGYNWCALGIELVAGNARELTPAQLAACARLIAWLAGRSPSIKYLTGHHEYDDRSLPHYALFREFDPDYPPTKKYDPGVAFMAQLREVLLKEHGLSLGK